MTSFAVRHSIGAIPRTVGVCAAALAVATLIPSVTARAQATLPARLSDSAFWELSQRMSEPNGYFRSDNLLSNETGFQWVVPRLRAAIAPGGVYLGVGPEQNFTYIAALQPRIAFIVDIRRGNLIEQLMYKALFELSADRADFLSRLFSRPRPAGLDSLSTAAQLFDAYARAGADSALYRRTLAEITAQLADRHGFALSDSDRASLAYVFGAFAAEGPEITYDYPRQGGFGGYGRFGGYGMPNYTILQTATDSAGEDLAYLASEARFRWLKDFESKNLLVPVVGDFGGPKALRAVGQYVRGHGGIVSAFYTSNVEQYLFQNDSAWARFYANVATLPLDSSSTFIRSVGRGRGFAGPSPGLGQLQRGIRSPSVTSSIQALVAAFAAGRIAEYADVITMSR